MYVYVCHIQESTRKSATLLRNNKVQKLRSATHTSAAVGKVMQCKISRLHMMLLSVSAMPVRNLSQATTRKEGKGEGKNARTDDGGSNVEFETSRQSQSVGLLPTRRILLVRARILAKTTIDSLMIRQRTRTHDARIQTWHLNPLVSFSSLFAQIVKVEHHDLASIRRRRNELAGEIEVRYAKCKLG